MEALSSHTLSFSDRVLERVRILADHPPATGARYVLYLMKHALRGHENPALDAALQLGRTLGLPVLAYAECLADEPYASDRLHAFRVEGLRDAFEELDARGVRSLFFADTKTARAELVRRGVQEPPLERLARDAACVVTEDMPLVEDAERAAALVAATRRGMVAVDTACVVPMTLVGRPHERAFEFRRAIRKPLAERIALSWEDAPNEMGRLEGELPIPASDPSEEPLDDLLGAMLIDHAIAPVPHTRGGSRAGYARFGRFVEEGGLARYARDRNDPLRDGVSRLSPYLHHGMVSPLRIAREAEAWRIKGVEGAEKYLDELIVWRELAYSWCRFAPHQRGVEALPKWARETLAEHEDDPRDALFDAETLARARTGDALWDAAQRSLLIHGELHNNVRMTWGKALVGWTPSAGRAMELLEELNHRYALDGRDPASYGGLWWCVGLFDRPFSPEQPVFGRVRTRPTSAHARRLDTARYAARTGRAAIEGGARVAVIGAGLAGLAAARTLADHALEPVVLEAEREPGGRLARAALGDAEVDFGAQYFTVKDPRFARLVAAWEERGLVEEWLGRVVSLERGETSAPPSTRRRLVARPSMDALAAQLALGLELRLGQRAARIVREGELLVVLGAEGQRLAEADALIVALPAPLAAPLVADLSSELAAQAGGVEMRPTLALGVEFPESLGLAYDAAFVRESTLSWIARDASKPGRAGGERWVLHAGAEASRALADEGEQDAVASLLAALSEALSAPLPAPGTRRLRAWPHAQAREGLGVEALFDERTRLALAGDWCPGSRVEGAFLSGQAAAGHLLRHFAVSREAPCARGQD